MFKKYGQPFLQEVDTLNHIEDMTYILTGKLNNTPFLMVDCIVTNNDIEEKKNFFSNIFNFFKKKPSIYIFSNKLKKLESVQNTYYSLTGFGLLIDTINLYDYWLSINNKPNDLFTGYESMNEIIALLETMVKNYPVPINIPTHQRIFFVNATDIVCYDLVFVRNKFNKVSRNPIPNNAVITSTIHSRPSALNIGNGVSLFDYCKNEIIALNGEDIFKDRFSFLTYNNNGVPQTTYPYNDISDVVLDYYRSDYDNL